MRSDFSAGRPVGHLRDCPRRDALAQSRGWQRAPAADQPAPVRHASPLVSGREADCFHRRATMESPGRFFWFRPKAARVQELLPENLGEMDPTWSPDGKRIAFGRLAISPETKDIEVLDLQTHQVSVLPGSQGLFSPRWSPDGRFLAALSGDSQKLVLFDFQTQKWTDWVSQTTALAFLPGRGTANIFTSTARIRRPVLPPPQSRRDQVRTSR